MGFFCRFSLTIRILQSYTMLCSIIMTNRCSHESWSSLLTSPLAENNRSEAAFQVLVNLLKKVFFKTVGERLVASSHVPTLKHKVKQQLLTQKRLISAALVNKQTAVSGSLAAVQLPVFVSLYKRTLLNIRQLSHVFKQPFSTDCRNT